MCAAAQQELVRNTHIEIMLRTAWSGRFAQDLQNLRRGTQDGFLPPGVGLSAPRSETGRVGAAACSRPELPRSPPKRTPRAVVEQGVSRVRTSARPHCTRLLVDSAGTRARLARSPGADDQLEQDT